MPIEMDKVVNLCKRRGFIFQSSEIYGGQESCWDYGPLGAELKRNVKAAWWRDMVQRRPDMVGLDASILMNPRVWKASGHVDNFSDPMVDCKSCKKRFRADHLPPAGLLGSGGLGLNPSATTATFGTDEYPHVFIGPIGLSLADGSDAVESVDVKLGGEHFTVRDRQLPAIWGKDSRPVTWLHPGQRIEGPAVLQTGISVQRPPELQAIAGVRVLVKVKFLKAGSMSFELATGVVGSTESRAQRRCPSCGGELTEPRNFNLMFKTWMGPVEDSSAVVYMRPETAQGIFVNFENVQQTMRKKLPFGIGQIGKAFRNEITPGNFTFRTREFEQMEIEYFVKPGEDEAAHKQWTETRLAWYSKYGMKKENLKLRPHEKTELAHYAKGCFDIEYLFPMGWSELEGIANRTDFDLKAHATASGKTLSYFEEETKTHIVPYVIEPSAGADRGTLAFLIDSYEEQPVKDESRTVLHLHPALAPVKVAVLPLKKNEPRIVDIAKGLAETLRRDHTVWYDDTGNIGKLYRRQDEIGTPFCVTIDFDTIENGTATVRERDAMTQERIAVKEMPAYFAEKLRW
jgi:glycyl-tRNA synthetase